MKQSFITTFDNPYDPRKDFSLWYMFDVNNGYNTCSYLSRITKTSEQFSETENINETNRAIDEIIKLDFRNIYKKLVKTI